MPRLPHTAAPVLALFAFAGVAPAADQKAIDTAVERGVSYLKARYRDVKAPPAPSSESNHGIGPAALSGLALLEAKVPANDPAVQAIASAVRDTSYRETRTYQIALCLFFLDHLEDPADVPLIQMLAVRLLAGQTAKGGWGYECVKPVPAETEKWLRATLKARQLETKPGDGPPPAPPAGKMHPDAEKYGAALFADRVSGLSDDNSNTQFGLLAVWLARKHGVPVEPALDAVERRFLESQDPQSGGWGYSGAAVVPGSVSGSMTCAGLLGLSTGVARREERRLKAAASKPDAKKDPRANDPFFNPPKPEKKEPEKKKAREQTREVLAGFACLGARFAAKLQGVARPGGGEGETDRNLYFLWSLERVGVIYGVDRIGGLDWYAVGSELLVRSQGRDGSWAGPTYGNEVCTSFALLFLCKADLARDLSSRVKKDPTNTELRSGTAAPTAPAVDPRTAKAPGVGASRTGDSSPSPLPLPVEDESSRLAAKLLLAGDADWTKALEQVRDAKGGDYTKAMVLAIHRLDGDRKKEARDALAERLTRMSAGTLRAMAKGDDAELRRGAVLACAMRDDKAHVPDLIDRLTDEEDLVVRAAKAGLKSLTGQDFGPKAGATKEQRKAAAEAWKRWWAKQK
jgi:hypothetical protein